MRWNASAGASTHSASTPRHNNQGPPLPSWRRGRNRLGLPAFVQTGPPAATHLGPARRPPPSERTEGLAPYRGLPATWSTTAFNSSVVGERGPTLSPFKG